MAFPEPFGLGGKRVLVTGAAEGIGKGCAIELARAGADVILNDKPGSSILEDVAEEIRKIGRRCWTIRADVFAREGCEELVERCVEITGVPDILISNPAYGKRCDLLDYPAEEFDRVIDATLKPGFHLGRATAKRMVEEKIAGSILFISSVHAEMPFARSAPYNAAKAGLNHLAHTMAIELAAYRINVNAIEPGWIDTPNERIEFSEETLAKEGEKLPWGRLGLPADVGRAAVFLVSDAAEYITGSVLPVDGGFRFKDLRAETVPDKGNK